MRKRIAPSLLLGLALGCGEREERPVALSLDEIPEKALETARAKLPDVRFDGGWKEEEGGAVAYEIRGRDRVGKIRDIKVTTDGRVLEVD